MSFMDTRRQKAARIETLMAYAARHYQAIDPDRPDFTEFDRSLALAKRLAPKWLLSLKGLGIGQSFIELLRRTDR